MEPLLAKNDFYCFGFYKEMLDAAKSSRDAVCPDDEQLNQVTVSIVMLFSLPQRETAAAYARPLMMRSVQPLGEGETGSTLLLFNNVWLVKGNQVLKTPDHTLNNYILVIFRKCGPCVI